MNTNTWLKKIMVALLALGIGQAAWADDVPNFKKMLQAAEQGNADAQFNLGLMYDKGEGVRQDDAEAVRWYLKAVEQEFPEEMRWYRKAVEQEFPPVQKK